MSRSIRNNASTITRSGFYLRFDCFAAGFLRVGFLLVLTAFGFFTFLPAGLRFVVKSRLSACHASTFRWYICEIIFRTSATSRPPLRGIIIQHRTICLADEPVGRVGEQIFEERLRRRLLDRRPDAHVAV